MDEPKPLTSNHNDMLFGGGSMGNLIRKFPWENTTIGCISQWPISVKAAVNIAINSRFPMVLWLGKDLNLLYNDAWAPILGARHPVMLGAPGRDVWPEIWNIIGPMLQGVLDSGEATWSEDMLLPLERNGFTEECYFTYSYSPIYSDGRKSEGAFSAVSETTMQVIRARRLATMKDLGTKVEGAKDLTETFQKVIHVLNDNPFDIPTYSIYRLNEQKQLLPSLDAQHPSTLLSAALIKKLLRLRRIIHSTITKSYSVSFPGDIWNDTLKEIYAIPILDTDNTVIGATVISIAPWLVFNEEYKSFLELIGDQIQNTITNALAFEKEVERAEKLAELDHAKSEFFNNVSHELRTPLTLIMSPLEELLRQPSQFEPSTVESLEIMRRNTTRLQKLVNGLLDFSKIESGKLKPVFEIIDISDYTRGLASLFQSAIEAADMKLVVDCESPLYASVDINMWEKIVINLLSNAFKHTLNGMISITVIEIEDGIQLSVTDTGIGITKENLSIIFERFQRIEGADSRTHEGTGIGLSVVQELVKLHSGEITVQSQPNQGTNFTVMIPTSKIKAVDTQKELTPNQSTYAAAHLEEAKSWVIDKTNEPHNKQKHSATALVEPSNSSIAITPCKNYILIVDDNRDMQKYIAKVLGQHWPIVAVNNGQEALDKINEGLLPDIVLTDVMMPKLNGFELLNAIRANPATRGLHVILLSARAENDTKNKAIHAAADDYLVKPFIASELITKINSTLLITKIREEVETEKRHEIENLNKLLTQSNDELKNFAYVASHDLQAPLRHICSFVNLIISKNENFDEQSQKWVGYITSATEKMNSLIRNLLEYSKVGNQKLNFETVNLHQVITELVDILSPIIQDKNGEVYFEELPQIVADSTQIGQLFQNLLTNALKFQAKDNSANVQIRVTEQDSFYQFEVIDNGIGINPEYFEKIFDSFQRLHTDAEYSGSGIGLATCMKIVKNHGGKLWVDNNEQGGSTFKFTLKKLTAGEPP